MGRKFDIHLHQVDAMLPRGFKKKQVFRLAVGLFDAHKYADKDDEVLVWGKAINAPTCGICVQLLKNCKCLAEVPGWALLPCEPRGQPSHTSVLNRAYKCSIL